MTPVWGDKREAVRDAVPCERNVQNCSRVPVPAGISFDTRAAGLEGSRVSAGRELRPAATSGRGAVAAGREGGHRALWRGALLLKRQPRVRCYGCDQAARLISGFGKLPGADAEPALDAESPPHEHRDRHVAANSPPALRSDAAYPSRVHLPNVTARTMFLLQVIRNNVACVPAGRLHRRPFVQMQWQPRGVP